MGFLTFLTVPGKVVCCLFNSVLLWVLVAYVIQYGVLKGHNLAEDGYTVPQSALVYSGYTLVSIVVFFVVLYAIYLCLTKKPRKKKVQYVPLSADIHKV